MGNKTTLVHNEPKEVVHIGKNLKHCSLYIQISDRDHKTLWNSGAGHCVISLDQYHKISEKFKAKPFESPIKIRDANGSEINNQGECDITFRIGQVKFTFPFLVSNALTQKSYWAITSVKPSIFVLHGTKMVKYVSQQNGGL